MSDSYRISRFDFDEGFPRRLLASDQLDPLLEDLSGKVADHAQDTVRRRRNFLAESIEVEVGLDRDDIRTGRVNAHDFKAHWWEFGYRAYPGGDPYLRPAAEAIVGKVSGGD